MKNNITIDIKLINRENLENALRLPISKNNDWQSLCLDCKEVDLSLTIDGKKINKFTNLHINLQKPSNPLIFIKLPKEEIFNV